MNIKTTNKRIIFLTGTRADYGKMKSLILALSENPEFEVYIFATGMHMLATYGSTYKEIIKDGFPNIYTYVNQNTNTGMDLALSNTITGFSNYISELHPDGIVVHGDRLEALAGAIVGAFHNIRVFHIEGGEISGTIDESIRHAITKFSHFHFVANESAKRRIQQLGEPASHIFVIGSPDIDIMYSKNLPTLSTVTDYYEIPYSQYIIFMYHPVTTEYEQIASHIQSVLNSLIESGKDYVIIYPNNDPGSKEIIQAYHNIEATGNPHFRIIPSMRFEYFLALLKNADCIIGNSSAGIREASIYGIPAIDIGSRQQGRYNPETTPHIIHIDETDDIVTTIREACSLSIAPFSDYGKGNSNQLFADIISDDTIWNMDIQKHFIDMDY
ncbi:MAG: UDP-N-acetylglucosamine 2-epimerase (hydrolyzing) [Lachnospiraceae bacterium]|nr:UDP-N-acetylglucosamine 2-epimerase (hydrolyzing) [Lachnospiraceae bacterium]